MLSFRSQSQTMHFIYACAFFVHFKSEWNAFLILSLKPKGTNRSIYLIRNLNNKTAQLIRESAIYFGSKSNILLIPTNLWFITNTVEKTHVYGFLEVDNRDFFFYYSLSVLQTLTRVLWLLKWSNNQDME